MSTQTTAETFAEIEIPTNPFPGLRPFEFDESHLFFGRDGQSEQLIGKLSRTHFLAVVGTSGSGKSSLVRAGFLPALYGGFMTSAGSNWRVAIMRPGSDPIGNLARALNAPDVFGSEIADNAALQTALAEATLRRGGRGLIDAVRQAVVPENENLLVVVDQFEEIFRFARVAEGEQYQNEAAAFIKLLLEASRQREIPIYVVLTMRSDYLGDCSQFWELPESINESQYLIPRLTRDQLREAITGPVAVGGGQITPRLVNRLLNDVGDNQDQLPVLQHLLMRIWDESKEKQLAVEVKAGDPAITRPHKEVHQGDAMDLCCSEAVGGMAQALSRHADEAFNELPDERHRVVAEKLFKALTEKGADNREIRRPIMLREICVVTGATAAEVVTVIGIFREPGRSFLMPPPGVALNSESLIDISHESLIRGWQRLEKWTEEEAQSARIYRRLAETATLHKADEEALLKDPALHVALDWRDKNQPNAAWARRYHPEFETAMSYLDASVAARDAEAKDQEQRRRREVSFKRTKLVAVLLAFSFLLSLGSSVYAFRQRAYAFRQGDYANQQRIVAEEKTKEALTQKAEALKQSLRADEEAALADKQAALAVASSIEATKQRRVAEAEKKTADDQRAIAEKQAGLARANEDKAKELAEKNRQLLYPADINLAQQAYESGNTESARELLLKHTPAVGDSPGFEWHYLSHLLASTKETIKAPDQGLISVITAPDGNTLAIGVGRKVELRNLGAGQTKSGIITLPEEFSIGSLAISADGKTLAVGEAMEDKSNAPGRVTVRLYDTQSLKPGPTLRESSESANAMVFTPDGRLVIGGGEGGISWWDVNSRKKLDEANLEGTINLAVSSDGKTLAVGTKNSTMNTYPVLLWDMSKPTNQKAGELLGHGDSITSLAFRPDGQILATGSTDKTVRLWDVEHKRQYSVLSFASRVFSLAYSPDGHYLAIGYEDGSINVCRALQPTECATLRGHHEAVISLSFSAGSQLLFSSDSKFMPTHEGLIAFDTSAEDTRVKSWDVATLIREQTAVLLNSATAVAYSHDGKTLVVGDTGKLNLLDAETNESLRKFVAKEANYTALAFSPDDKLIATADDNNMVRLWNASTVKPIGGSLEYDALVSKLAFSPDGKFLAGLAGSGTLKLWDIGSGRLVSDLSGDRNNPVLDICFPPAGKSLVTYRHGILEVWDLKLQKPMSQFKVPGKKPGLADLSPDARILALSYEDSTVVLYDTVTIRELGTFKGQSEIDATAFSSDSKTFVTAGGDGTLKLWDLTSFRELLTLKGTPEWINFVTFSPDGKKLATLNRFHDLRIWRAPRNPAGDVGTKAQSEGH